jgi:hypothetical protein
MVLGGDMNELRRQCGRERRDGEESSRVPKKEPGLLGNILMQRIQ